VENAFFQRLMNWYGQYKRDLPWRNTSDPYIIWLSEIILQQTRVEQGLPYFFKFMENFPNVKALAEAPEDRVMKCWQGLGYYSRARNLHSTAKYIAFECGGEFPQTYESILALKGVGPYTAAAIASFAFGEAVPVVDGNVYRFVARYLAIDMPIGTSKAHPYFSELLKEWMPANAAAAFNQAMMEFGALHCTPAQAKCETCPFQIDCQAFHTKSIYSYPVKAPKTKVKEVYYHFLVLEHAEQIYVSQRDDSGLWKRLWHFPLIESSTHLHETELLDAVALNMEIDSIGIEMKGVWNTIHLLSHRKIHAQFWELRSEFAPKKNDIFGTTWKELEQLALPQIMVKYLNHRKDVGK